MSLRYDVASQVVHKLIAAIAVMAFAVPTAVSLRLAGAPPSSLLVVAAVSAIVVAYLTTPLSPKFIANLLRERDRAKELDRASEGDLAIPRRYLGHAFALKRVFDIVFSAWIILVALPLYAFVAIALLIEGGGPVFVREKRLGRYNRVIRVTRFRTYRVAATVDDDHQPTPVGRLIERYRFSHAPMLWDVLRGDLAIIGPRPRCLEDIQFAPPWAEVLAYVRPGVTGVSSLTATLRGTELIAAHADLLDIQYVQQWSLGHDVRILMWLLRSELSGSVGPPPMAGGGNQKSGGWSGSAQSSET
jgi:lipopolysaccharide/colanic/teichoic acid biosynthesis glycosyltransferase